MNVTITLPFPSAELSPNARLHHQQKARIVHAARQAAKLVMLEQCAGAQPIFTGELTLEVMIFPPDARHRDLDNIFASLKPSIDGLCDALQINDARIHSVTLLRCEREPGGKIVMDLFDRW